MCGFGVQRHYTRELNIWFHKYTTQYNGRSLKLYLNRKQPVTQQIIFPRLQFLFVTLNDRFRKNRNIQKNIFCKNITKFVSVQIVASKQPVATYFIFFCIISVLVLSKILFFVVNGIKIVAKR